MDLELPLLLLIATTLVFSQNTTLSNSSCTESCDCPEPELQEFFESLPDPPKGSFLFSGFLSSLSPFQVSSFVQQLNATNSFVGNVELPEKKLRVYRNCERGSLTYNQYFMLPLNYPKKLAYVCGSRAECNLVVMDLKTRELLLLKNYNSKRLLQLNRCLKQFGVEVKFTVVKKSGTKEMKEPQKMIPGLTEQLIKLTSSSEKNSGNNQHASINVLLICLAVLVLISCAV